MTTESLKDEVKARWSRLDASQRKLAVFLPCTLIALFIATHPHPFAALTQFIGGMHRRPQREEIRPIPTPRPVTPPAAPPQNHLDTTVLQTPGQLLGRWQGRGMTAEGTCNVMLEIRQEQDHFIAYPRVSCLPMTGGGMPAGNPLRTLRTVLAGTFAESAVMTGTLTDDGMRFELQRSLTANQSHCTLVSPFTVTAAGFDQVSAAWKDSCGAGQLTLSRMRG